MNDPSCFHPCWFEYTATLSDTSHEPDGAGTPVHCVVELQAATFQGGARDAAEREAVVGDLILFALKPGPSHCLGRSKIWEVAEGRLAQLGEAPKLHCVGGCRIHHYAG